MYDRETTTAVPVQEGTEQYNAHESFFARLRSFGRDKSRVRAMREAFQEDDALEQQGEYNMQNEYYQNEEAHRAERPGFEIDYSRPKQVFHPDDPMRDDMLQSNMTIVSLVPMQLNDGGIVIRHLKRNHSVLMRLAPFVSNAAAESQRFYDYVCGAAEALGGSCLDQGGFVYLLVPRTVHYIDEEQTERVMAQDPTRAANRMSAY